MNLILFFIGSYLIGNLLTAYLLIRWIEKDKVELKGSGNPGAKNMGRLYGKKAFIITFFGDALKGSIVIIIGRALHLTEAEYLTGMAFAVIGHIKPILHGFKGGKGISTFIGGIITFEPILAAVMVLGFSLSYPFTKSFTISGLTAICFIPIAVSYMFKSVDLLWVLAPLIVILILAHSKNLRGKMNPT